MAELSGLNKKPAKIARGGLRVDVNLLKCFTLRGFIDYEPTTAEDLESLLTAPKFQLKPKVAIASDLPWPN
ncbi:MAG: hypothetical protein K0R66_1256 [Gammaproteobacteria bacterium]|nr:hypothetical protein [Gammaproteobacteria bacterium]